MKLGVLVSGEGTNLQALIDAGLPIAVVISNRENVPALARAGQVQQLAASSARVCQGPQPALSRRALDCRERSPALACRERGYKRMHQLSFRRASRLLYLLAR